MTVWLAVHCPHCQSTDVKKHGTSSSGKRRYRCLNPDGPYETFSQSIDYPGRRQEVKQQIVEMTLNGSGVRDIARVLHISTATVIKELKKVPHLQAVNQKLLSQFRALQLEQYEYPILNSR